MNTKWLFVGLIILFLHSNIALAYNPYGEVYTYDVYYNGKLLPGTEVAKPTLKIGEPFTVKIDLTVYQEYKVSGKLMELGSGNFEVVDGPSEMDRYSSVILKPNESHAFEWTVKPTDKWAGGSLPINFHYSIVEKGNPEPVVNSEFTIAYPYITTEYNEGDTTPTTTTDPESPTSTDDPTTPSTPAFTLLAAALTLTIAAARRS